jgi:hypothetical protein
MAYYTESRKRGISCIEYKEGRVPGLVTSFVETAVGVFWWYNSEI